ncbi:uncharacterized protein LOC118421670 [Branchiostoma floridae]|uniref:Uncharacterized protein LOC118421670 n=1 Tax=Branchiostoma floridae TaxID=7739 RepID=A0A9J7MZZ3_BRAFL|nr:uncharacterized protein LOC118421670 [Branchiostoma floridae]
MPGEQCKQRLRRLMGTDVVRINDQRYMEKLRDRIVAEYEAEIEKRESQLVLNERKRERRLVLQGLMPPECPCQELFVPSLRKKCKCNCNKQKKKLKKRKTSTHTSSSHDGSTTIENQSTSSSSVRSYKSSSRPGRRPSLEESFMSLMIDEEEEKEKAPAAPQPAPTYSGTSFWRRNRRSNHYQPAVIDQMEKEQTVAGLYRLAEKIIIL